MENINALRLIKSIVENTPTSEMMDDRSKTQLMEFINVQIDIEMDVMEEIPGFEGTMKLLDGLTILK